MHFVRIILANGLDGTHTIPCTKADDQMIDVVTWTVLRH